MAEQPGGLRSQRISSGDSRGPCHCVLFASSSEQPEGGGGVESVDGGFELRMGISPRRSR